MQKDLHVAFVGTGTMGGALARGLSVSQNCNPRTIALFDTNRKTAEDVQWKIGELSKVFSTGNEACAHANVVVICVKPNLVLPVLSELSESLAHEPLVISIAAGITVAKLVSAYGKDTAPVVRAMPNTPCLIGEGATAFSRATSVTDEQANLVKSIFSAVGSAVEVEEKLMDAVTGLSGSGPAYVYLFIESLIDAGVNAGLPRVTARALAVQTVLGSALLMSDSTQHPAQLKDDVTTPGGTTIAALTALERTGFRASVLAAVTAARDRSKELSQI